MTTYISCEASPGMFPNEYAIKIANKRYSFFVDRNYVMWHPSRGALLQVRLLDETSTDVVLKLPAEKLQDGRRTLVLTKAQLIRL